LNKLTYFGEGPNTVESARSFYGMTQTIAGVNAVFPVLHKFKMSLYAEANTLRQSPSEHGATEPFDQAALNTCACPRIERAARISTVR